MNRKEQANQSPSNKPNLYRYNLGHGRTAYCFPSRFLTINSVRYEIVWTESTGPKWDQAVHTVRDCETRKEFTITTTELVKRLLKYETIEASKNAVR